MRKISISFLAIFLTLTGCIETQSSQGQENPTTTLEPLADDSEQVFSLLEIPLPKKQMTRRIQEKREQELLTARINYEQNPDKLDNIIWYGRRLAYLGYFKEAIRIYSIGLDKYPTSHKLLRHRGHRYITVRNFSSAIEDLQKAAFYVRPQKTEIEPDGLPNRINQPLSNTKFNIWYHLGLAYYMKGNYDKAISSFKQCMEFCDNDDLIIATTNWFYMTYRKTGNQQAAEELLEPIHQDMTVIEYVSYYRHLLMYKGIYDAESLLEDAERENNSLDPTAAYSIANWYLYNGNVDTATAILNRIILNDRWDAIGYIASEVDLLSLKNL